MAAQYDAGSIEARLTVDQTPFDEGLRMAQEKAQRFEDGHHNTDVGLNLDDAKADEELRALRARLAELSDDGGFTIKPDVDTVKARAEIDELRAKLAEIRNKDVTVRVNTEESRSQMDKLRDSIGRVIGNNNGGDGGRGGGGGGDSSALGITGMIAKFATLGTLGGGLLNPLAGEVGGLAGAFGIAGIGVGSFAVVAHSSLTKMQADSKAVTAAQNELTKATTNAGRIKAAHDLADAYKNIKGPEAGAIAAQQKFNTVLDQFHAATAVTSFGVITKGYGVLGDLLPRVTPMINASGKAIGGLLDQVDKFVKSGSFTQFTGFISKEIGPVLNSLGGSVLNFGKGLMSGLENAMPVVNVFLGQIRSLSSGFSHLTASPEFVSFMKQLAGDMRELTPVVSDLFGLVGHLLTAIQPLVKPVLSFLDALIVALGPVVDGLSTFFTAIAKGLQSLGDTGVLRELGELIGKILVALTPLIPPLFQLIDAILPPLIKALGWVVPILTPIVKFVGLFATSAADLIKRLGPVGPILFIIAGAMLALNLAMDAGPIGLVVLAIAGLVIIIDELIKHWGSVITFAKRIWHDVAGFFESLWRDVSGFAERMWHDVTTWFSRMWHDVVVFVERLAKDVGKWFSRMGSDVAKFASRMWHDVTGFVSRMASDVGKFFSNLWHTAVRDISNLVGDVVDWFKGLPGKILRGIGDLGHLLWDVGVSIIDGLINGLKSAWDHVTSWISDAGGWIKSKWNDVMSIFSPSRVMHTIGRYITMGLHEGMIEGFAPVLGTIADQANKIKNGYSLGIGSINVKPVVTLQNQATMLQTASNISLAKSIDKLHDTVKALPAATGEAVGDTVGSKFEQATKAGAKATLTAMRQGAS